MFKNSMPGQFQSPYDIEMMSDMILQCRADRMRVTLGEEERDSL